MSGFFKIAAKFSNVVQLVRGKSKIIPFNKYAVLGSARMVEANIGVLLPMRASCSIKIPQSVAMLSDRCKNTCQSGGFEHPYKPIVFVSSPVNEYISLRMRLTRDLLPVDQSFVSEFQNWALSAPVLKYFFGECQISNHLTYEQVLNRIGSSPAVKKAMGVTVEKLKKLCITAHSDLDPQTLFDMTMRSMFIKQENLLYRDVELLEKAARVIQGAQHEFTLIVSSFVIPFSDLMKKSWNKNTSFVLASGLSNETIGLVGQRFFDWGRIYEDDVSQWDVSIRKVYLIIEREIFRYCGAGKAVLDLITANIKTHGKTRFGYKYKTPDGRKSGDPYTTIGNSMLNVLFHAFIYLKQHNLTIKNLETHMRQMVAGDDNVICCKLPCDFKAGMLKLGFKSTCIERHNIWDVSFCSARFLRVKGGTVLCPNFARVLMKFGTFATNLDCDYNELCAVSAKGLYKSLSFIPCVKSIFDEFIGIDTSKTVIKGGVYKDALWNSKMVEPSDETWFDLYMQFGFDVRKVKPESKLLVHLFRLNTDAPNALVL